MHMCAQVITGPLDALVSYTGPFCLLSVVGLANERRSAGYNSSVVLWECHSAVSATVIDTLLAHCPYVFDYVHRFDHWLEMTLPEGGVDFIQVSHFVRHLVVGTPWQWLLTC